MTMPRCGDHVYHRPSQEKWLVAYADADRDELAWAGWPEGIAKLSDCELIHQCSDADHAEAVRRWLDAGPCIRRSAVERLYPTVT